MNTHTLLMARADYLELIRRYLVLLATALWFGGFTFYSLVVIHTGHKVFGGMREVGFLTQQVTWWLNLIGVVALLILLWNALVCWRQTQPLVCSGLLATWLVMGLIELALFALHPHLDQMLDPHGYAILQRASFRHLHNWYVNLSTIQWGATLLHLWLVLAAWFNTASIRTGLLAPETSTS